MLIIWLRPDLNPNRSTGVQRLRQGDSGARIALIPCYLADVTPRCHVHPKHAVSSYTSCGTARKGSTLFNDLSGWQEMQQLIRTTRGVGYTFVPSTP